MKSLTPLPSITNSEKGSYRNLSKTILARELQIMFTLAPDEMTKLSAAKYFPGNLSGLLLLAVKKVCLFVSLQLLLTTRTSELSQYVVPAAAFPHKVEFQP